MHERLLEHWLDRASERSYQAPFCQMLQYRGYRIVHTTRHSPIELGRDITAIDPKGNACAFQLKGNPGGRLTLRGFREILGQLSELVSYSIEGLDKKGKWHRSFLVTNGLVEEEALLALDRFNQGQEDSGYPERKLELIERGQLLKWAMEMGPSMWPTELDHSRQLLEFLVESGQDFYDLEKADAVLAPVLGLEEERVPKMKVPELKRRIASAGLIVSITLISYEKQLNHWAKISAWSLYSAYVIAACERYNFSFAKSGSTAVRIAKDEIFTSLVELSKEALEQEKYIYGSSIVDFVSFRPRHTLVSAAMSLLWFWCDEEGWPNEEFKAALEERLDQSNLGLDFWGEGAAPQLLMCYWYLRRRRVDESVEGMLYAFLKRILEKVQNVGEGLASPYWTFDDVARHLLASVLGDHGDKLRKEAMGKSSYFVEGIFHLLVRTNRKQLCKLVWPDITKLAWASFQPKEPWSFCLWRSKFGENIDLQPPRTKDWNELQKEAIEVGCGNVPTGLGEDKFLLALFVLVLPYRATPMVIRNLGWQFDETWFAPPPRLDGVEIDS